jgi:hypothetical protein
MLQGPGPMHASLRLWRPPWRGWWAGRRGLQRGDGGRSGQDPHIQPDWSRALYSRIRNFMCIRVINYFIRRNGGGLQRVGGGRGCVFFIADKGTVSQKSWRDKAMVSKSRLQN